MIGSFKEFFTEAKKNNVKVPSFKTRKDAEKYVKSLGPDDSPTDDVVDPESGEVIMMPGETKRAILKKSFKKRPQWMNDILGPIVFYRKGSENFDEDEITDFYNVVKKSMADVVDDPEYLRDNDYDVDYTIPVLIKRKDGQPLDNDDLRNMKYYVMYFNDLIPDNISLEYYKQGDKMVRVEPTFI